jgi:predicted transcriptional regulator
MPSSLLELTASIVSAHASVTEMSTDDLLLELQKVHTALTQIEGGSAPATEEPKAPAITLKKAFQPDQVICMICGKGGMKTLTRHLNQVHGMKPGAYRKQFGIPSSQSLTARNFSESRRKMAQDRDLAANLAKAREVRAAKLKAKEPAAAKPAKTAKPAAPAKPAAAKKAAPRKKA